MMERRQRQRGRRCSMPQASTCRRSRRRRRSGRRAISPTPARRGRVRSPVIPTTRCESRRLRIAAGPRRCCCSAPGRARPAWRRCTRSTARSALSAVVSLLIISLTIAALLLARYNVRSGRADRRAAARLALFVTVGYAVMFLITAHHLADVEAETNLFTRSFGRVLIFAGAALGDVPRARAVRAALLARWHPGMDAPVVWLRPRSPRGARICSPAVSSAWSSA